MDCPSINLCIIVQSQRQTHLVHQNRKLNFLIRNGMEIGEKRFPVSKVQLRKKKRKKKKPHKTIRIMFSFSSAMQCCLVLKINREIFIQLWLLGSVIKIQIPPDYFALRPTWTMFLMIEYRNVNSRRSLLHVETISYEHLMMAI